MELLYNGFLISDDRALISVDKVHQLLSKSYWANTRSKECIKISISNSICYGVFLGDLQIGFARVITDFATTYYLADVIIDDAYRNNGLGKKLVEFITNQDMFKKMLGMLLTDDAHGLYEQYGFYLENKKCMVKKRSI